MTIVAIHQPTFLPWLGWWDKLVRADVFVLLDDVQFPKKGATWMNRVRILVNGKATWLTVPIDRTYHGVRAVREIAIDDGRPWREKALKTVATSYGRAPSFDEVYPVVEEVLRRPTSRLADLTEAAIRRIAAELDLDAGKLVRQSELGVRGLRTDLLVALCRAVDGSTYLTGDGADDYLEEEKFGRAGLALVRQNFTQPEYAQQADPYVPGLSMVDAAMSCGWRGTASLLRTSAG